jgi:hypothetical protein
LEGGERKLEIAIANCELVSVDVNILLRVIKLVDVVPTHVIPALILYIIPYLHQRILHKTLKMLLEALGL